jgi:hypothetical protein
MADSFAGKKVKGGVIAGWDATVTEFFLQDFCSGDRGW